MWKEFAYILLIYAVFVRATNDNTDVGLRRRQEYVAEEAKLCAIRDKMLRDMEAAGVNPKYLGEMKNIDIAKAIRR